MNINIHVCLYTDYSEVFKMINLYKNVAVLALQGGSSRSKVYCSETLICDGIVRNG